VHVITGNVLGSCLHVTGLRVLQAHTAGPDADTVNKTTVHRSVVVDMLADDADCLVHVFTLPRFSGQVKRLVDFSVDFLVVT
jgi:hypothetical protein